jgi:hypothetical protein
LECSSVTFDIEFLQEAGELCRREQQQVSTIGATEEGIKSGVKTISRMRDETIVYLSLFGRKENDRDG